MSSLLDTNFDIDLNAIAANRINRIIELDYSRIKEITPVKKWKFINYKPNKNIENYALCQKTILNDDGEIILMYRFINVDNYENNRDWNIVYFKQKYPIYCELPLYYDIFKEMKYKFIDDFLQILGD